jgi:hypothetical protein
MIAAFVTGPIIAGVINLIKAFVVLRQAIQDVGIVGAIVEAILTGGVSLAQAAVVAAIAAIVAALAHYGLNKAFGINTGRP